jgi:hypothetical protein
MAKARTEATTETLTKGALATASLTIERASFALAIASLAIDCASLALAEEEEERPSRTTSFTAACALRFVHELFSRFHGEPHRPSELRNRTTLRSPAHP